MSASLDKAQKFVDKNYRVPGVAGSIDPKKSFWKDVVTYPYPVKYANAKDKRGTVLADRLHGRIQRHRQGSAGAGHHPRQGRVRRPLRQRHASSRCAAALRVIAPDLPHYGMSGPGNLDKSPARTMQDMREVDL